MAAGQEGAVVEGDRLLGVVERPVLEPLGQVQAHDAVAQVGHRPQCDGRLRPRRSGEEAGERAGQGRAASGGRRAGEELPSAEPDGARFARDPCRVRHECPP